MRRLRVKNHPFERSNFWDDIGHVSGMLSWMNLLMQMGGSMQLIFTSNRKSGVLKYAASHTFVAEGGSPPFCLTSVLMKLLPPG
mmetsp:Transcript_9109/g.15525  ORF Transcript_9109/g.15525 Transcript_9109/m.15525 type:complete len:84 (+) Transcript_9109:474-725(+)